MGALETNALKQRLKITVNDSSYQRKQDSGERGGYYQFLILNYKFFST